MNFKKLHLASALLWATAILLAALFSAPTFFTIILLPLLAFSSLQLIRQAAKAAGTTVQTCGTASAPESRRL
ncbi:hypothetical protein SAMN05421823_104293 [Catalinimonas alkaloidigena]|uniref:Uncharacterized protein n=1 Tax=Catalinimonas alkaloidigena TaxID=1075417 RepID=A0A1G9H1W8_9BACT|nr:hypothetical protein [Catalinimonas alkaloidigena]SDL06958.1 hypothetical protein SAMN05421823_104293 [Catalinimonas alkaloidigena]